MPLGILGVLYGFKVFPDFRLARGPFDVKGFLLIGIGVLAMTAGLELTGGKAKASAPWAAAALAAASFLCISTYVRHARQSTSPLINLNVFKTRTFSVGIAGNVVARLGIGSIPFLVPLFLQTGLGYPADIAGLLMLTPAMASIITKTVVLRVLGRFGYRRTLLFLTLSIGGVFMLTALQQPETSMLPIIAQLFIQGLLMSVHRHEYHHVGSAPCGNGQRRQQSAFSLAKPQSQLRDCDKHCAAAPLFRNEFPPSGSARDVHRGRGNDSGRRPCIHAAAA